MALADDTVASDMDGWDSLAHMKLLVALEDEYNISFLLSELTAPGNVGGTRRPGEKQAGRPGVEAMKVVHPRRG